MSSSIGPKIVLEGEKEYRKAISDINKDMRVLSSEMKAASVEFDGNANSIQALSKKHDILSKEYDEQTRKIKTLQGALENAEKVYDENSNQVKDWQIKLNNAEAELTKLDRELKTNEKYLDEAKTSTDGTAKSIDKYGKEINISKDKTEEFNKELDKVKSGIKDFGKVAAGAVVGLTAALIGVTESTAEFRQDFSKLDMNARTAGASIDDVSEELKNLDAITGETDSNIEALSNLMAAGFKGDGLTQAVEALSGAVIKFPDTLKIEGLADGLQETLATGQAVGPFSELLERLGYNLGDFNTGLAKCTTEAERQQYALNYLAKTGLSNINDQYRKNNKTLIDNANAQYDLRENMSRIAETVAPSLNRAMQKVADTIENVNDNDVLPSLIDGLDWVIDNSDLVIGGIAGTIAAMKAFSILEAVNASWKAYKVATEGATVAQWALNVAQMASPIGLLAAGIGLIVGGIATYALSTKDATEDTDEFGNVADTTSKNIVSANNATTDSITAMSEAYQEELANAEESIYSSMGLFDEFSKNTEISGETLMKNLRSQVKGMEDWSKNMQELARKGIEEGLLQELYDMGPAAAGEVAALNKMTNKQLQEYNQLWIDKTQAAKEAAIEQTELTTSGIGDALGGGKTYVQAQAEGVRSVVDNQFSLMRINAGKEGENTSVMFGGGIKNKEKNIYDAARGVTSGAYEEIKGLTGKSYGVGKDASTNIGYGINDYKYMANENMKNAVSGANEFAKAEARKTRTVGTAMSDGVASGIKDKDSSVKDALGGVVQNAVNWVKKKWNIQSPSRVLRAEIGNNLGDGIALGIEDKIIDVKNAMSRINDEIKVDPVSFGSYVNSDTGTSINGSQSIVGDTIIYVNNPQPNPSELAKQIKKQQQNLALGW